MTAHLIFGTAESQVRRPGARGAAARVHQPASEHAQGVERRRLRRPWAASSLADLTFRAEHLHDEGAPSSRPAGASGGQPGRAAFTVRRMPGRSCWTRRGTRAEHRRAARDLGTGTHERRSGVAAAATARRPGTRHHRNTRTELTTKEVCDDQEAVERAAAMAAGGNGGAGADRGGTDHRGDDRPGTSHGGQDSQ